MSTEKDVLDLEKAIFNGDEEKVKEINEKLDKSNDRIKKIIAAFLLSYKNPTSSEYNKLFGDISEELKLLNQSAYNDIKSRLNTVSDDIIAKLAIIYSFSGKIDNPTLERVWGDLTETWKTTLDGYFSQANKKLRSSIKSKVALQNTGIEPVINNDKIFGTIKNGTKRIVHTESGRIRNDINKSVAINGGFTRFRYSAIIDNRTSDICRSMNGRVFPISKYLIGVTVPPLHVYCRSSIILLE